MMLRSPESAAVVFPTKKYPEPGSCLLPLGRSAGWLRWLESWTLGIRRIWASINGWEVEFKLWIRYVFPSAFLFSYNTFFWKLILFWTTYRSRNRRRVKFYDGFCRIDMRRTRRSWKGNFNCTTLRNSHDLRRDAFFWMISRFWWLTDNDIIFVCARTFRLIRTVDSLIAHTTRNP